MSVPKRVIPIVGLMLLIGGGYAWARGTTWSRAEGVFLTIEQGFERGHPKAILSQIHMDYDYLGHWPELEYVGNVDGAQNSDLPPGRQAASIALRQLAVMTMQDKPDFTFTLHEVKPQGGGLFVAKVDFALNNRSNPQLNVKPHTDFTFTLRQDGLMWPTMRIIDHTPVGYP